MIRKIKEKMSNNELKFDFSNYDYSGTNGCPECKAIKMGIDYAIHPEEVPFLCPKHLKEFKKWHSREVSKGNIGSWFL